MRSWTAIYAGQQLQRNSGHRRWRRAAPWIPSRVTLRAESKGLRVKRSRGWIMTLVNRLEESKTYRGDLTRMAKQLTSSALGRSSNLCALLCRNIPAALDLALVLLGMKTGRDPCSPTPFGRIPWKQLRGSMPSISDWARRRHCIAHVGRVSGAISSHPHCAPRKGTGRSVIGRHAGADADAPSAHRYRQDESTLFRC